MTAGLAQAYARAGDTAQARELAAGLTATAEKRHVPHSLMAQVSAALGDMELAVAALERAASAREPEVGLLGVRPVYAPLRSDAKFQAIRQRVGV